MMSIMLGFASAPCRAEDFRVFQDPREKSTFERYNLSIDLDSIKRQGDMATYRIRWYNGYSNRRETVTVVANCVTRKRGQQLNREALKDVALYSTFPGTITVTELDIACNGAPVPNFVAFPEVPHSNTVTTATTTAAALSSVPRSVVTVDQLQPGMADPEYAYSYFQQAVRAIEATRVASASSAANAAGEVLVYLPLAPDGSASQDGGGIKIARGSGDSRVDGAAIDILKRALPLPSFSRGFFPQDQTVVWQTAVLLQFSASGVKADFRDIGEEPALEKEGTQSSTSHADGFANLANARTYDRQQAAISRKIKSMLAFQLHGNTSVPAEKNASAEYFISLSDNGSLNYVALKKSSDLPEFDDAVRKAIVAAQPFSVAGGKNLVSRYTLVVHPRD